MKRSLRFGLGLAIITLPLLLTLYTFRFSLLPQVLFVPLPGTSSETLFALGNSQTTPTVSFSDPTYTVVENAGSRSINVTLNISSTQTVQISYQTQDESAQAAPTIMPPVASLFLPPVIEVKLLPFLSSIIMKIPAPEPYGLF